MMKTVLASVGLVVLAGCAHSTMRGSVAMKISDREAHVCMGNEEVKAGDRVTLFQNVCTNPKSRASVGDFGGGCEKRPLGEGVVTRLLNEHYSVVEIDPGVSFQDGTIVEKKR